MQQTGNLPLATFGTLLAAFPPETAEVEVVAYGPGLTFVRKGSAAEVEIQGLEANHVRFVVCENSMRMQHISAADLVSGVEPVPSGVVEVVTKQEQGWSYIKAGR
jgi:uncharacterized protein